MPITAETLKRILAEFGGTPMTDAQLNDAVGAVQTWVNELSRLNELDLDVQFSSNLLRTDDGGYVK